MRSLITGLTLAAITASSALADGCWRRSYTAEHMARNPSQTVQTLQVQLPPHGSSSNTNFATAWATFRDGPEVYVTGLVCWEPDADAPAGAWQCGVECDGGSFVAWPSGNDEILLRTRGGFIVEGGCGEEGQTRWVTDEGAAQTTFKLYRIDPIECQ